MIHISKVNFTGPFRLTTEGQNVVQIVNSGGAPVDLKCTKADGSEEIKTLRHGHEDKNLRYVAESFHPSDDLESIEMA